MFELLRVLLFLTGVATEANEFYGPEYLYSVRCHEDFSACWIMDQNAVTDYLYIPLDNTETNGGMWGQQDHINACHVLNRVGTMAPNGVVHGREFCSYTLVWGRFYGGPIIPGGYGYR